MVDVLAWPRSVAVASIEKLELDGDGLLLDDALRECEAWHTQMEREDDGNE